MSFPDQIETVCNDLKDNFWDESARVICNSFGAYIFLHAQAQLGEPYVGNVLLLSPIVGELDFPRCSRQLGPMIGLPTVQ